MISSLNLHSVQKAIAGKVTATQLGHAFCFLRGHGEAATHHARELLREITGNITSQQDRADFMRVVEESIDLYLGNLDNAANGVDRNAAAAFG